MSLFSSARKALTALPVEGCMPGFERAGGWLNSKPLAADDLRGKVVLADLVAAVLADAEERDAGVASAINNAVARVAGLIGVSVVGVVVAQTLIGDTFAANEESVHAFHQVVLICSALLAAGGVAGAVGIVNPRRVVEARTCPGGQLVGVPLPAVELRHADASFVGGTAART
jgi:hypothetical protein